MRLLRELQIYLLPDGREYVAVASGSRFLLYRARPDYLDNPRVYVVERDGTVKARDEGCAAFRGDEIIDTGQVYS